MENIDLRKLLVALLIFVLIVLSFLILRPILMSIIFGFILAFILYPLYKFINKYIKHPNVSATIVIVLLLVVILIPIWFLTPVVIQDAFKVYLQAQQLDFTKIITDLFPATFGSEQFVNEFGGVFRSFVIQGGNAILDWFSGLLLNFPTILLQMVVILFALFFGLRDKEELISYVRSLSPFSKEINHRLFKSSKEITASVLYGQVVVGIIQGVIVSLAFFIFGVPKALLLSILATILGILPIVGPMFVWIPVMAYMFLQGNIVATVGILIFGIVASNIDNILRPMFVSRFTKLHSAVVLVGMIGGLFIFGILGIILGPLILAYLLIVLEIYRSHKSASEKKASPLLKED